MSEDKLVRIIVLSMLALAMHCLDGKAQFTYGTTGLLNMPTADMQKDKTVLLGGAFLNKHASASRWFYDTYNYYANITIFPFLEVSYNLVLHKAVKDDYGTQNSGYWVPNTYGKFINQDRQFMVRLRLWKEGWWRSWTPQVVVGSDDISSHSWGRTKRRFAVEDNTSNGFSNRYYLAVTKHFDVKTVGQLGVHLSYLYNVRSDYALNALSVGANFRLALPESSTGMKLINKLNIMAEAYPANGRGYLYKESFEAQKNLERGFSVGKYDINIGAMYSIWKEHVNLMFELYGCRHFSGGVQFKLHL